MRESVCERESVCVCVFVCVCVCVGAQAPTVVGLMCSECVPNVFVCALERRRLQ